MKVMMNEDVIVNRMEHLSFIHFVSLVVHIHLCLMQKTKLEIEGVVNTVWGDFSREQCIQIVVLTICKDVEVL